MKDEEIDTKNNIVNLEPSDNESLYSLNKISENAASIKFAQIPNKILRNEYGLSPQAAILLCSLLSHRSDFNVSDYHLRKTWGWGIGKLKDLKKELRNAGFMRTIKPRNASGHFEGSLTEFSNYPEFLASNRKYGKRPLGEIDGEVVLRAVGKSTARFSYSHTKNTNDIKNTNDKRKPTNQEGSTNDPLVGVFDNLKKLIDFGLCEADATWALEQSEGWVRCVEVMDYVNGRQSTREPASLFMSLMRNKAVLKKPQGPQSTVPPGTPEQTYTVADNQNWWEQMTVEEKKAALELANFKQCSFEEMLKINKADPFDSEFSNVHWGLLHTLAEICGRKKARN